MDFTSSLIAKLGLNNSEFRSKLKDSIDETKGFKKAWKDIGDLFAAGGATAAIIGFFKFAIEAAKNSKDATDENVAAVRRWSDSLGEMKTAAGEVAVTITGWLNRIGEAIGKQIAIVKHGREQVEVAEKIEKQAQETLATIEKQKKQAAEFKKAADDIRQAEEKRRELTMKQLTDQEKINRLQNEILDAERKVAAAGENRLDKQRAIAALKVKENELLAAQIEQTKKLAAEDEKARTSAVKTEEKRTDAVRETMTAQERKKSLLREELALVQALAGMDRTHKDFAETNNRLLEVRKDLRDAEKQIAGETAALAALELKGVENLTAAERVQLDVLKGRTTQRKNESEITMLVARGVENLTDAEKDRLRALIGQSAEIKNQLATLRDQEAVVSRITNIHGRQDKQLSDRELAEKRTNLSKQLKGARDANDTGAFFFQQKLAEVQFEIDRRADFRRAYARDGERAFQRYSAFDEQTLRQYIRPEDQKRAQDTLDALRSIEQRISRAFPRN